MLTPIQIQARENDMKSLITAFKEFIKASEEVEANGYEVNIINTANGLELSVKHELVRYSTIRIPRFRKPDVLEKYLDKDITLNNVYETEQAKPTQDYNPFNKETIKDTMANVIADSIKDAKCSL